MHKQCEHDIGKSLKRAPSPGNRKRATIYKSLSIMDAFRTKNEASGFTLAEVLITLGVIGVVAAMTMPIIVGNYQKKQIVVKLKQAYSILNQATNLSQVDNGNLENWQVGRIAASGAGVDYYAEEKLIIPYLKVVKNCGRYLKDCKDTTFWNLAETESAELLSSYYNNGVMLANGMAFYFGGDDMAIHVLVDVDPSKKKKVYGKNLFRFFIIPKMKDYGPFYGYGFGANLALKSERHTKGIFPDGYGFPRQMLLSTAYGTEHSGCRKSVTYISGGAWCTALILMDNKISKDYPW